MYENKIFRVLLIQAGPFQVKIAISNSFSFLNAREHLVFCYFHIVTSSDVMFSTMSKTIVIPPIFFLLWPLPERNSEAITDLLGSFLKQTQAFPGNF